MNKKTKKRVELFSIKKEKKKKRKSLPDSYLHANSHVSASYPYPSTVNILQV